MNNTKQFSPGEGKLSLKLVAIKIEPRWREINRNVVAVVMVVVEGKQQKSGGGGGEGGKQWKCGGGPFFRTRSFRQSWS